MTETISLAPYFAELDRISPLRWTGEVTEVVGLLVESRGPASRSAISARSRPPAAAASAPR